MSNRAYGLAMVTLLGLGSADLAVLNLWAVPNLTVVADVDAATDASARVSKPAPTAAPLAVRPVPAAPQPTAAAPTDAPAATVAQATLLFRRGSWWVDPAGRRALRESLARLGPDMRIEVEGHADEPGSPAINQRISERRAAVVASMLARAGVDPRRIRTRAFGESQSTGTSRDRRVQLMIRGER